MNCGKFITAGARTRIQVGRHGQETVWQISSTSARQVHRFEQLVRQTPTLLRKLDPAAGLLLCCITQDCIVQRSDLIPMASAIHQGKIGGAHGRVSWSSSSHAQVQIEVRCISDRTRLASQRLPEQVDWNLAIENLSGLLKRCYMEANVVTAEDWMDMVLNDATCWWYLHLPICLTSHLHGEMRMKSLSDLVLKRLSHTAEVTQHPHADDRTESELSLNRLSDVAFDNMFESDSPVAASETGKAIELLKTVFSVGSNRAGIRLATYLNTQSANDRLVMVSQLIEKGGWITATLASWAAHLLSVGSIRRQNPAMSTLSAYMTSTLEPLAAQLRRFNKRPALYAQEDWTALFAELADQAASGQQSAALASLHSWAIRNFGMDPMPEQLFRGVHPADVHANLIWRHEQETAFGLAVNVCADERLNHQVRTLIALGCAGLFRIGDLVGLNTEDLHDSPEGLRVHINPRRGTHAGKSRAARRFVRLHDAAASALVRQWRDRRNGESGAISTTPVLLFGDPHAEHKLYKIGACLRLVNETLKNATGDETVSFHTLRHTEATRRAYRLLVVSQAPSSIAPLDELTVQMGHATKDTLWTSYFHLPEFVIRKVTDQIPAIEHVSAPEAAFWLGTTPELVRQRACRSGGSASTDAYRQLCRSLADKGTTHQRSADDWPDLKLPRANPALVAPEPTFSWVRQALRTMTEVKSLETACSRLSCTPDLLGKVGHAIQRTMSQLAEPALQRVSPLLLEGADPAHVLACTNDRLRSSKWQFVQRLPAVLQRLDAHLESLRVIQLGNLAAAWTRMHFGCGLSMHDPMASTLMLQALATAGWPSQAVVLRLQEGVTNTEAVALQNAFLCAFRSEIRTERVRPRRGHPRAYLLLSRTAIKPGQTVPSATLCMRQVHGLFMALCVYCELKRSGGTA